MKKLSRRTMLKGALKGAGTMVALPFLDAMLPAFGASTPQVPMRMLYVYAPTGIMPQYWTPTATGRDFEFQRVMKPLEKYREDVLVMTGLSQHEVAAALQDGAGDHVRAFSTYLNGVRSKKTLGADFQAGISADQVAAKVHGEKTRLASLELTCENSRTVGECDSYTCAYQTMAYKSSTEPLIPEMNPRVVFERMFGDMDLSSSPAQRKNQELYRRSILDLTMQDASSLQRELGPTDRRKLDEYFTCIRDLETRIAKTESGPRQTLPAGVHAPAGVPAVYADHALLMFELIRLAFQTDTTRVVTFALAREGGLRPYPEIGVPEAHHSISHHGGNPELIEKLAKIQTYHMEQFAKFVGDLKSTPDGAGTMLDHTATVYGAGLADPNVHDHDHCPTLMVGNAAGKIKTGQHVVFKQGTPLSDLHLTMLDLVGVPTDKLGNSDGQLNFLTGV
jgi:hypothetical protein